MANLVRTFGDEDMKEQFAKLEITKLPQLLSEVQRRIGIINQKEAFSIGDETKTLINEAMMDIEFTFSKIGQEEMRLISGGAELKRNGNAPLPRLPRTSTKTILNLCRCVMLLWNASRSMAL